MVNKNNLKCFYEWRTVKKQIAVTENLSVLLETFVVEAKIVVVIVCY